MRVYALRNPFDQIHVHMFAEGTWAAESRSLCPTCGRVITKRTRAQPLILEWEVGSDKIGDFTWSLTYTATVLSERATKALKERFAGFEPGPVEMIQNPKLKKPVRISKRMQPRIWLPYEGPPLFELWVTTWAHLDEERSTIRVVEECKSCGPKKWEFEGIERWDSRWDATKCELVEFSIPRIPGKGLFVKKDELQGADIFRFHEAPVFLCCTDRVKEFVEREGFTNVRFCELGDVI